MSAGRHWASCLRATPRTFAPDVSRVDRSTGQPSSFSRAVSAQFDLALRLYPRMGRSGRSRYSKSRSSAVHDCFHRESKRGRWQDHHRGESGSGAGHARTEDPAHRPRPSGEQYRSPSWNTAPSGGARTRPSPTSTAVWRTSSCRPRRRISSSPRHASVSRSSRRVWSVSSMPTSSSRIKSNS